MAATQPTPKGKDDPQDASTKRPSKMPYIYFPGPPPGGLGSWLYHKTFPLIKRVFHLDDLDRICGTGAASHAQHGTGSVESHTLDHLHATFEVSDESLANIPESGPVLLIANHPFGMVEGLGIGKFGKARRADYQTLANEASDFFPDLLPSLLTVNLDESPEGRRANVAALRKATRWLDDGHCLGIFPAGEVSHRTWRRWTVTDSPWNKTVAMLAKRRDVQVVPICFHGCNGWPFQLAGLLSAGLRTALLPGELESKRGMVLQVSIGKPITPDHIKAFNDNASLTEYLRSRVYMLQNRRVVKPKAASLDLPKTGGHLPRLSSADRCAGELLDLSPKCHLLDSGDLSVYIVKSRQSTFIVNEIGRLREVAFREIGEGTGKDVDLDRFDRTYRHLFIWNNTRQEVVGAYRLGLTDEIVRAKGLRGLYTRTLFDYDESFLKSLGPSIELGRAFIRPEYQRTFKPLLLLWKGLCSFISRTPRYRYSFGVVSISNDYDEVSKRLMTEFLATTTRGHTLKHLISARTPHEQEPVLHWDHDRILAGCSSIEHVDELVREIEHGRAGVPILIKQYLKLDARLLSAFNVDKTFANVIDGLMLVDFTMVQRRIANYYMGADAFDAFLQVHGITPMEHLRRTQGDQEGPAGAIGL
jgi:putative hemolysin